MSDVKYIDNDQYNEVVRLLDSARAAQAAAKSPRLNLARKLELLAKAKLYRAQAMAIGH